jgi:hypothetical protein
MATTSSWLRLLGLMPQRLDSSFWGHPLSSRNIRLTSPVVIFARGFAGTTSEA